jgi:predicted aspartyl protease
MKAGVRHEEIHVCFKLFLFCGVTIIMGTLFSGCMATGIHHRTLSSEEVNQLLANQRQGLVWPDHQYRPDFFIITGSKTSLRLSRLYHWFVPVRINGKTYRFLVDTGSADCAVDPFVALRHRIPLIPGGTSRGTSAAGSHKGYLGILPSASLGELKVDEMPVIVQANSVGFRVLGVRLGTLHGVIGNRLLSRFVVTFDAGRRRLDLVKHSDFRNATTDNAMMVPFALNAQGHIQCSARINGQGPFPLLLDTGAEEGLLISQSVADKCNISLSEGEDITGWGGARTQGFQGEANSIRIGPITLSGIRVVSTEIWTRDEVVIGASILKRYRTTIDYSAGKIYLEKR